LPCRAISFVLFFACAACIQGQSKPPRVETSAISGVFADGLYRNNSFGFSYKVRYGWVDRTEQMRDGSTDSAKAQVLLAVFEHPPEVKGDGVNPAIIIAAESLSSYPSVKTAADYFEPLSEAVTSQGFKVVNEPYETTVGSKSLVRGDFSKASGKLTSYQSSLVILSKGYAVSFTYIGANEDEVEELISRLNFAAVANKK
jgi:hypothetical protein